MRSLFHYTDYRQFLKDRYQDLRAANKVVSYRYLARRAGFASPNFLKLVMERQRNLSSDSWYKVAQAFGLNERETAFFELLVQYSQSDSSRQKQHFFDRMMTYREYQNAHQLLLGEYKFLASWYYPVLLELAAQPDFRESYPWLKRRLRADLSTSQLREALDVLVTLGLLKRDDRGRLTPTHQALTTGDTAAMAAHRYHEQILDQAKAALGELSDEEREYAAMTMNLSQDQLQQVKIWIRDFRRHIMNQLGDVPTRRTSEVFTLGIQLFPMTKEAT